MHPPRGQSWNEKTMKSTGGAQTHMSPSGLNIKNGVLTNSHKYTEKSLNNAVVQVWRGSGGRYVSKAVDHIFWPMIMGNIFDFFLLY